MSPTGRRRRSALVAPASDERKALKALQSDADEVVLDLEDAVTAEHKTSARRSIPRLVESFASQRTVSVRINAMGTPWYEADLEALSGLRALASVVVPKVSSGEDIIDVDRRLQDNPDIGIQALLETPDGILDSRKICAASERVEAVIIGYADLGASLGRAPGLVDRWGATQDAVLLAARASGIQAIDGPYLGVADDTDFRRASHTARDLGFDGKWVIHPGQIHSVTDTFTPSDSEVGKAERILAALAEAEKSGAGAALLEGQMLDEAVAVAARRVLAQAGAR